MLNFGRAFPALLVALVPCVCIPGCGGDDPDVGPGSSSGQSPIDGSDGAVLPDGAPDTGCGNGLLDSGEACDDANAVPGDGCSADCKTLEEGFVCEQPGAACVARCGDGKRVGDEECDDGNVRGGEGCSAACQLEEGFQCLTPNAPCERVECGDGEVQGLEQCDDANVEPYDGCYRCKLEPVCTSAGCQGICGDGVIYPGEVCDDGNVRNGDGCSSTCTLEAGFSCTPQVEEQPSELVLPAVYRDFKSPFNDSGTSVPTGVEETLNDSGHPDFERFSGVGAYTGLVEATLGTDGTPTYLTNHGKPTICALPNPGHPDCTRDVPLLTGADEFYEWYHPGRKNPALPSRSRAVVGTLTLARVPNTATYVFDSNLPPYKEFSFFPLDGADLGWGKETTRVCRDPYSVAGMVVPVTCEGVKYDVTRPGCETQTPGPTDYACIGPDATIHNFFFTTELHFVFTFNDPGNDTDGPELSFTGDDDVWIFINGKKVVDLGGLHGIMTGSVKLTRAVAQNLGLADKGVYDIALFHAERKFNASNFKFTLAGFVKAKTVCEPICGDGIKTRTETCDDGVLSGDYNKCAAGCVWGPRCGDGVIQREFGEQCDDRNFQSGDGCTPGCQDE